MRTRAIGASRCQRTTFLTAQIAIAVATGWNSAGAQIDRQVWQVRDASSVVGSAVLIDNHGYYLTASHVLRRSGKVRDDLSVYHPALQRSFPVELVPDGDLAGRFEGAVCVEGSDLALLRAEGFTAPLGVVPAALSPRRSKPTEEAIVYGYSGTRGDALLPIRGNAYWARIDTVANKPLLEGSDFYVSGMGILRGYSGGPLVVHNSVIGITSFAEFPPGGGRSNVSYFVPIVRARPLIELLTNDTDVDKLWSECAAGRTFTQDAIDGLGYVALVQIVSLLHDIHGDKSPFCELAWAVANHCTMFQMTADIGAIYQEWKPHCGLQMTRARGLGDRLLQMGAGLQKDGLDAQGSAELATAIYLDFLGASLDTSESWVGRRVVSFVASSCGQALALQNQEDDAAGWFAISNLLQENPGATASLASYCYKEGGYAESAALYSEAYRRGLTEHYVTSDFEKALQRAALDRSPRWGTTFDVQEWREIETVETSKRDRTALMREILDETTQKVTTDPRTEEVKRRLLVKYEN